MAVAFIQSNSAASNSVAFSSNNTAGNFLVCCIGTSGDVTNVTDTRGNAWSKAVDQNQSGILLFSDIWYVPNCANGANTVTLSGGFGGFEIIGVAEYSGVATSTPIDQTNSANNSINNPDSGPVTTTQASELLVGVIAHAGNNSAITFDSPWTQREDKQAGGIRRMAFADRIVSSTGTYNATGTFATSPADWQALIATFKAETSAVVVKRLSLLGVS